MSLRSRSHDNAFMVLTIADHLCLHDYIRSLLNNILPDTCVTFYLTMYVIYIYINICINPSNDNSIFNCPRCSRLLCE